MSRYMLALEAQIYNYVLGRGAGRNFPRLIREDPVITYIKSVIREGRCPFCGRSFTSRTAAVSHLTIGNGACREEFQELIKITADRYLMLDRKTLYTTAEAHR